MCLSQHLKKHVCWANLATSEGTIPTVSKCTALGELLAKRSVSYPEADTHIVSQNPCQHVLEKSQECPD